MSNKAPHVTGAEAPQKADDLDLQELVAGLIKLSIDNIDNLNSYSVSTCDEKIHELAAYINQPTGEARTVPNVLGQLSLLLHRKVQLQAAEHVEQLVQLQENFQLQQLSNSRLRQEVTEIREANERIQQDYDALRTRFEATQVEPEEEKGTQVNRLSTAADLFARESPETGSDHEAGPLCGATRVTLPLDDPANQLRAELRAARTREATLRRRLEDVHLFPGATPAEPRAATERQAVPSTAASDLLTLDSYQAPRRARVEDTTPNPSGVSRPAFERAVSHTSDTMTPRLREGGYYRAPSSVSGLEPPPRVRPSRPQSIHPHLDWTPPAQTGRSHTHRYSEERHYGSSDDSDGPGPPREQGLRTRHLESLAKDIERFDPGNKESNIDDYLREVDRCLLDLPRASAREKLKLIWKTTARSVHVFMETLPPGTRDRYSSLCLALREEYSLYTDQASATLGAFAITQRKQEPPREYYRRLRAAYFQGRNAPGLEEDRAFKSLFLHNLHESVRYDVTMHCRTGNFTMQEVRRYAQVAWETRIRPTRGPEGGARVLGIQTSEGAALELEGNEMPRARPNSRTGSQGHRQPRHQGGQQSPGTRNPAHPQDRGRQRQLNQPNKRVQFERNTRQEGKYDGKGSNHPMEESLKWQMEELVRKYVAQAARQLEAPSRSSTPPDPPKKPDNNPPSA